MVSEFIDEQLEIEVGGGALPPSFIRNRRTRAYPTHMPPVALIKLPPKLDDEKVSSKPSKIPNEYENHFKKQLISVSGLDRRKVQRTRSRLLIESNIAFVERNRKDLQRKLLLISHSMVASEPVSQHDDIPLIVEPKNLLEVKVDELEKQRDELETRIYELVEDNERQITEYASLLNAHENALVDSENLKFQLEKAQKELRKDSFVQHAYAFFIGICAVALQIHVSGVGSRFPLALIATIGGLGAAWLFMIEGVKYQKLGMELHERLEPKAIIYSFSYITVALVLFFEFALIADKYLFVLKR